MRKSIYLLSASHNAIIIIIMDIYKASTLLLKVLDKHSITHIMYIVMENVNSNLTKGYHIMN